jgi:hypothetical protein
MKFSALMANIQKLNRFENPRNELIAAYPSGPADERQMAADFCEKSDFEETCHGLLQPSEPPSRHLP